MPTARARTEAARDDRRDAILRAAEGLLLRDGFEAATAARVAEAAGLAKGTTYLYFRTREEVFLALFIQKLDAFAEAVAAAPPGGPDALAEAIVAACEGDPAFVPLLARLGSVIEQNLGRDALYAAKARIWAAFGRVTDHLAPALSLDGEAARRVGMAVMAALMGAAQGCAARPPDDPAMPDEVRAAFALSGFGTVARTALGLILAGAQRASISA